MTRRPPTKNHARARFFSSIIWLAILACCTASSALASEHLNKRILLLNSYHQRMVWVKDIVRGVEDVLKPERNNYTLYVENMDTKEFHSTRYFEEFRSYLAVKYGDTHFDLILCSDNNSYDFLRHHRDQLFPEVPVVFCGVNNFAPEQLEGLKGFTGVAEIFSARETIELALQLQPEIRRVYVVNDYLKTGRLWALDIEKSLAGLKKSRQLIVEHSPNLSLDELLQTVGALQDDTIVLLGAYFSDRNQQPVRYEQIASLLSTSSAVPVYCLVEFVIDEGLVGGHVISGYYQGYSMAQLGLSVLIGTDPDSLPVMLKGSNKPILNYQQLTRFGLDPSRLSTRVEIVNKPFSLFDQYRREILIIATAFVILLGVVFALILNTRRLHRARAELRVREEQMRQLADATWEAILIHDGGRLLQVNTHFTGMFGYTLEELKDTDFLSLIYDPLSCRAAKQRIKNQDFGLYEATGRHKNGVLFPIEVRVREMEDEGRMVRVVAIRDLTERKEMEKRLAQSQKMEAIGTLAGGIAHDFNNILSAIIGYSELTLLGVSKDSTAGKNLAKILQAGNRAKTLVQQILTFARKSEQQLQPVQVSRVIEEAMKLLRPSMPASIEIIINLNSNASILGDPTKIHQIVMNLCTNSGKAMVDGGVLELSLDDVELDETSLSENPEARPGPYVRLRVKDTGVGIPEDILPRIFDPFFTTRQKVDGTGLGLAVVHGAVKEAGGIIRVDSSTVTGTIFDIFLPILEQTGAYDTPQTDPLPRGSESIMLVDDERALLEVGQQGLVSLGYRVTGYSNSGEGLEAFSRNPQEFDLVITDFTMPGIGGDKLAARLLNIRPDLPIIIYTGYSENFSELEAKALGVKRFLLKPVDLTTLATTIRQVLDGDSSD